MPSRFGRSALYRIAAYAQMRIAPYALNIWQQGASVCPLGLATCGRRTERASGWGPYAKSRGHAGHIRSKAVKWHGASLKGPQPSRTPRTRVRALLTGASRSRAQSTDPRPGRGRHSSASTANPRPAGGLHPSASSAPRVRALEGPVGQAGQCNCMHSGACTLTRRPGCGRRRAAAPAGRWPAAAGPGGGFG